MRQNCRDKFLRHLKQIKELEANAQCNNCILIVDDKTRQILSKILKTENILDYGIKANLNASIKKKAEPNAMAIYYISKESLEYLIRDFKKEALYFSVNILMCEQITEECMKSIGEEQNIMDRLASFAELHLDVDYLSENIGIICNELPLPEEVFFNRDKYSSEVGDKLFEALICGFGDYFELNIFYLDKSNLSKSLLQHILLKHQEHRKYLRTLQIQAENNQKPFFQKEKVTIEITLLLVDRKWDLISPIVRNFNYFPLISTIFKVNYDHLNLKIHQKEYKINLEDSVFLTYKNMHISKALTSISQDLSKFTTESKAAQLQKNKSSIAETNLKDVIKEIPEYNRKVQSFNEHIQIMNYISSLSKAENIIEIGELHHLLITNINSKGDEEKDKKILLKCSEVLAKKIFNTQIIVELLILMALCLDVNEAEKIKYLTKITEISKKDSHIVDVLIQNIKFFAEKPLKLKISPNNKEGLFLDRHQSLLANAVQQILIEKKLPKMMKNIKTNEEIVKAKVKKFEKIGEKKSDQLVVFMGGGISINQICQLERKTQNNNQEKVSFITDRVLNSHEYLEMLVDIFKIAN